MSDVDNGERWVGVAEAAALLGKSDRTIRRMVSDGRLTSRKDGARLLVEVSDVLPASAGLVSDVSSPDVIIASLRAELDTLRGYVEHLSDENDKLWRQVEAQQSVIEALTQVREQKAIEGPAVRPWWQFWRSED